MMRLGEIWMGEPCGRMEYGVKLAPFSLSTEAKDVLGLAGWRRRASRSREDTRLWRLDHAES